MSFVIQKLATHPNVMERLQNEVDENLEGVALEPDNVQQIKVRFALPCTAMSQTKGLSSLKKLS